MSLSHSRVKSFSFALEGIFQAFKKEPNLRIHTTIAVLAIVVATFLKFNTYELLALVLTIFLVLTLEFLNTAIEALVDLVSPEVKAEAKIAKDISAAVVLLASILAFIVGTILFVPKIIVLVSY